MEQELEGSVYNMHQPVVTRGEVSQRLDALVQQMKENATSSLSGMLVSGYRGTGKTFLVENYLQGIELTHPVLIARHYPQYQNIPYFGFKYCISNYLSKIYNQSGKNELHNFSERLSDYLGESRLLLIDYFPELSMFFGLESRYSVQSHLTIENQLYPAFKRLFEFLGDYYHSPVLFFTDDLQWIDASGINLLKYLLLNLPNRKLIWIGAYRLPQKKISLVGQLVEELRVKGKAIENIFLKGLNREEVKSFVELTLGASCHQDLTDICYKLTEGNPSQLQGLLETLRNSNLIWREGDKFQCQADAVITQYKGQKTKNILLDKVKKLSSDAYDVLCLTACVGRFDRDLILDWLKGDALKMNAIIEEAVEAGLLEAYEHELRFPEREFGEMIYNELSDSHKSELHFKIANLFYSRSIDRLNSTDMIMMATNFNQSIERVKSGGLLKRTAELNFKAGNILQKDKAYDQARYFFKMSAEMLKECPWEEVSELVWLVYMDRARIEYYMGDYDLAEIHLDYLLERINDPLKRSKVFELKVTINNHLGRYQKVVLILKESLKELGLELPLDEQKLHDEVSRLKSVLSEQEREQLNNLATNELAPDYSEAILKLLYVGGMSLHHNSDVLMTWAALQIILRANRDIPSVVKAIGYVSYGRMLIIAGDIEKGYEFGAKGLTINKALDDITLRCRVFGVYAFYIQTWMKDFSESKGLLEEAAEAGRKAGDLIGLYILKTHQLNLHIISGLPLKGLSQWDFDESYPGMELTYYITHYQKNLIRFLTGENSIFSIPRQNPSSLAGQLTIQEEKFYRNYVWARYYFLFGYYDLAAHAAEEAHANRKLQEASPLLPANLMTWFLAITQNWYNYPDSDRSKFKPRMEEVLRSFDLWKNYAPSNYRPTGLLLRAEWCRINGQKNHALECFQKSFAESGSNNYHRAVASELWAKFLLRENIGDVNAKNLLLTSVDGYNSWDGRTKAQQLTQQFGSLLSMDHNHFQSIDIETIQYELSGDMEVSSLVKKMMVLLLRISGSTRVVVELREDGGERILYDEMFLLPESDGKQCVTPTSAIMMALKSQNVVVMNDLNTQNIIPDIGDLQAQGVQSFLIIPVTISGHLTMGVYLENIFRKDWYVAERVRFVKIAANQGAVMIENARIHEHSVQLNDELRKEMTEKERLSSIIEAQKDAHLKALMQAQNNERNRIARDLHDSLGSLLSSVRLRFNGLQHDVSEKVPEKAQRYNDTLSLLDEAIHELRQISHNMVPVSLSRFGLRSALTSFVSQLNASGQLDVDLQILGMEERLPEEMEVHVYRICQELVQNVIKHSKATKLRVQIILHNDSLNILVEDNGIGMQKESITQGFGFNTIKSNVDLFKGTFDIESHPGNGCLILIDLPIL